MPFTTKDWRDAPGDLTTPISATAMEDLETRLAAYADAVGAAVPASIPSGLVQWTAASAAPSGWLAANGAAVSRTTYAALYAALGGAASVWGQGNGSTTFTLPDLRDRAPVGSGTTYALGAAVGAATVTLTAAEMPAHTHTGPSHTHPVPDHTHALDYVAGSVTSGGVGIFQVQQPNTGTSYNTRSSGATTATAGGTGATGSAGTGTAHNNLPPSLALLPIIKT